MFAAVLEQYDKHPYAVRVRLRFVLKRRLHQDSIEAQTRYPGSPSMNQVRKPKPEWRKRRRRNAAGTPHVYSSRISFLSSSFEPRPTFAASTFLFAIVLPRSSTAPEGVAVLTVSYDRPSRMPWMPPFTVRLAVLEQYEEHPYAVRVRLRFVLKRRLHQDSIEAQTRYPGSLATEWWAPISEVYTRSVQSISDLFINMVIIVDNEDGLDRFLGRITSSPGSPQ